MSEYVCGKSSWLLFGRLNFWAEHGTASVGKSDEKDTGVGVKLSYQQTSSICFYLVSKHSEFFFLFSVFIDHSLLLGTFLISLKR